MKHLLMLTLALAVIPGLWADGPEKKLIEYGWDVPTPAFIRANLPAMEQQPFDGVIFRLEGGGNVLEPEAWPREKFAADYDNLRQIEWARMTDNFLIMWAASTQDWFNDDHWRAVENNTALVARAARIGRCAGICFDPEPYGQTPWDYAQTARLTAVSFEEYQRQVRLRGAQFMRAVEREFPGPVMLFLYEFALFAELQKPMDPVERTKALAAHPYGLYPAFLNGMLEGASAAATFVDGNENSYYYESSAPYFEAYHRMTQGALFLVDPALHGKYRAQGRAGQAMYVDQYFGLRADPVLGSKMTPEERPLWLEHNAYHALLSSDRYAWCYSEKMNWWTGVDVPPGAVDALRRAREKVNTGQPLGVDLAPVIAAAKQR